ncbi:hypothetical protein CRUP_006871 [Coryphaenoides rupestris]|nr:hypothetical protein CRUP_006871 [Coryphaenoides rupestris]
MRIAVLGATGQTGQYLVSQALQGGHTVTAIVRNPGKLVEKHDNLKVVEADIFSADSLKTHFQDQDAVLSCLGFPTSFFSAVTGYTQSMSAVVGAMRDAKVSRLIAMTSWYTEPNSGAQSPFLIRNLLLPMIRSVLGNMYEMEAALQATEDIDWTVKDFLTHEGYFVPDGVGNSVPRGDVARFMLSLLHSSAWLKKGVAIHTK